MSNSNTFGVMERKAETIADSGPLCAGSEVSFLQVSDIQKMMGISRASAYALVKRKGFPHIQVGNRIVIPFDLFSDWIIKTAMAEGK